jgi:hypothetical protein
VGNDPDRWSDTFTIGRIDYRREGEITGAKASQQFGPPMKLPPSGAALIILCTMCGCSKPSRVDRSLTDEQIIAVLNERLGSKACCFYVRQDQKGDAVYGPLNARREIHLIIRRSVGDEDVACGFSGFPKARAFNGSPMSSGDDAVFVVRNRRLFTETEMKPIEFDRLQDQRCGPDWVKPYRMPPAPSVR